jgi:MFS family permease
MYIDKFGRKPVLIVGAIGMASCHFIIAAIFGQNQNQWDTHKAAGWGAVAMVWLFVIHFGYCKKLPVKACFLSATLT